MKTSPKYIRIIRITQLESSFYISTRQISWTDAKVKVFLFLLKADYKHTPNNSLFLTVLILNVLPYLKKIILIQVFNNGPPSKHRTYWHDLYDLLATVIGWSVAVMSELELLNPHFPALSSKSLTRSCRGWLIFPSTVAFLQKQHG